MVGIVAGMALSMRLCGLKEQHKNVINVYFQVAYCHGIMLDYKRYSHCIAARHPIRYLYQEDDLRDGVRGCSEYRIDAENGMFA